MSNHTTSELDRFMDRCETLIKVRNELIREIDAAFNPVCNDATVEEAIDVMVDVLIAWARARRQLEDLARKHHLTTVTA